MIPLLRLEHVSVRFGGLQALQDVSFAVAAGSTTALIGPNGAGKTTLFNVISGLQAPTGGRLVFDDRDITKLSADARARLQIRRSFQNLGLMMGETVRTTLLAAQVLEAGYAPWDPIVRPWRWRARERAMTDRAVEIAERVGIVEHLDTRVEDLSFGLARRTEIAAALLGHPRLLLLDEPTTGLDVAETAQLAQLLRDARVVGVTQLFVAHDVEFVMGLCDHVHVLVQGELVASGPPDEVRADPRVISAYLGEPAA